MSQTHIVVSISYTIYGLSKIVLNNQVLNSSNSICSIDFCHVCLSFLTIYVLSRFCNFDLSFMGIINCILSCSSVSSSSSHFFDILKLGFHLSKK